MVSPRRQHPHKYPRKRNESVLRPRDTNINRIGSHNKRKKRKKNVPYLGQDAYVNRKIAPSLKETNVLPTRRQQRQFIVKWYKNLATGINNRRRARDCSPEALVLTVNDSCPALLTHGGIAGRRVVVIRVLQQRNQAKPKAALPPQLRNTVKPGVPLRPYVCTPLALTANGSTAFGKTAVCQHTGCLRR